MVNVPMFIVGSDYFPKSTEDTSTPLTVVLKCRDINGHRRTLHVRKCVPRFWTAKDPTKLNLPEFVISAKKATVTTVTKEPLWEIRVKHPGNIREIREMLYPHYSADVPYHAAVRWHYGWKSVIEVEDTRLGPGKTRNTEPVFVRPANIKPSNVDISKFKLSTLWYDIETQYDIFHKPEDAGGRVISIAIYDQNRDKAECAIHTPVRERMVRRMLGTSEALESLIEHDNGIPPLNAERITVKSIEAPAGCDPEFEDDEAEAALFHWFNRRLKAYDPDVIAGHNIRDYDNPYLKNRARLMNNKREGKVGCNFSHDYSPPGLGSSLTLSKPTKSRLRVCQLPLVEVRWLGWPVKSWDTGKFPGTRLWICMKMTRLYWWLTTFGTAWFQQGLKPR